MSEFSVPDLKQMITNLQIKKYRSDDFGADHKRLWLSVILQGIIDLRERRYPHYDDARQFFLGKFIKKVCIWVDLDYNKIIDNLKTQGLL